MKIQAFLCLIIVKNYLAVCNLFIFPQYVYQYEQAADAELAWVAETKRKLMALGPIRLEQDQTTAQLQVQKVSGTVTDPLCSELIRVIISLEWLG